MSGDLEHRLERALSVVEEPPARAEARLRAAALAALARRRPHAGAGSARSRGAAASGRSSSPLRSSAPARPWRRASSTGTPGHRSRGRLSATTPLIASRRRRRSTARPGSPAEPSRQLRRRPRVRRSSSRRGPGTPRPCSGSTTPCRAKVVCQRAPTSAHRFRRARSSRCRRGPPTRSGSIFGRRSDTWCRAGRSSDLTTRSVRRRSPSRARAPRARPLPVGVTVVPPPLLACQTMHGDRVGPDCPASALPPGAPLLSRFVSLPTFVGEQLPDALAAAQTSGLGLFAHVGYLPAKSDGALARAGRPHRRRLAGLPPDFVRSGYAAPGLYRTHGRAGVSFGRRRGRPAGRSSASSRPRGRWAPRHADRPGRSRRRLPPHTVRCGSRDCVPGSARSRQADPALSGVLPWLSRGADGALFRLSDSRARPSLAFPAGTTYLEALKGLLVSVVEDGHVPEGWVVGPPLRRGVVVEPPSPGRGPVIDLRAPFGYDPVTGEIAQPSTAAMAGVPARRLRSAVRSGRAALLPPPLRATT